MNEEIDGYLSHKIQEIWSDALVYCVRFKGADEFVLRRPGCNDIILGRQRNHATNSVKALTRAERARSSGDHHE